MKKKSINLILIAVICACCFCIFCGCQNNEEEQQGISEKPSYSGPYLAYRGQYTTYPIDDITLTFYCGSDFAGENKLAGSPRYDKYPVVTYIYVNREDTYQTTDITKEDLYDVIEENENFYICKKILSTDSDSFYKCNGVTRLFSNLTGDEAYDAWGADSPLYCAIRHGGKGIAIPDVSYTFTIPREYFYKEEGYVSFGMASYISEDDTSIFESYKQGKLLEEKTMSIHYKRYGDHVTLGKQRTQISEETKYKDSSNTVMIVCITLSAVMFVVCIIVAKNR